MSFKKLIVLLVVVIALAGCGGASEPTDSVGDVDLNWQTFTPTDGKFQISMPGVPTDETSFDNSTPNVPVITHNYKTSVREKSHVMIYMISTNDYPANTVRRLDANNFLKQTWQAGFGKLGDRIVYKRAIKVDGYPGLEFQYKSRKGLSLATSKHILIKDRLYLISAIMGNGDTEAGYANRFLDSFKATP